MEQKIQVMEAGTCKVVATYTDGADVEILSVGGGLLSGSDTSPQIIIKKWGINRVIGTFPANLYYTVVSDS